MKYRIQVEIEYLIALSGSVTELDDFPVYRLKDLRGIFKNFTEQKAEEIKEIEKTTNHDVKALEYYIKKEFDSLKLEPFKEFVHFVKLFVSLQPRQPSCFQDLLLSQFHSIEFCSILS